MDTRLYQIAYVPPKYSSVTLTSDIGTSTDTIPIQNGGNLPDLTNYNDPDPLVYFAGEWMQVTAKTSTELTVNRGALGSEPKEHASGKVAFYGAVINTDERDLRRLDSIQNPDVKEVGEIEQTLEYKKAKFRISNTSVTLANVVKDRFNDAGSIHRPWVFEILDDGGNVVFSGIVDGESASYDAETRLTSFDVLSWLEILDRAGSLPARDVYEPEVVGSVRSESSNAYVDENFKDIQIKLRDPNLPADIGDKGDVLVATVGDDDDEKTEIREQIVGKTDDDGLPVIFVNATNEGEGTDEEVDKFPSGDGVFDTQVDIGVFNQASVGGRPKFEYTIKNNSIIQDVVRAIDGSVANIEQGDRKSFDVPDNFELQAEFNGEAVSTDRDGNVDYTEDRSYTVAVQEFTVIGFSGGNLKMRVQEKRRARDISCGPSCSRTVDYFRNEEYKLFLRRDSRAAVTLNLDSSDTVRILGQEIYGQSGVTFDGITSYHDIREVIQGLFTIDAANDTGRPQLGVLPYVFDTSNYDSTSNLDRDRLDHAIELPEDPMKALRMLQQRGRFLLKESFTAGRTNGDGETIPGYYPTHIYRDDFLDNATEVSQRKVQTWEEDVADTEVTAVVVRPNESYLSGQAGPDVEERIGFYFDGIKRYEGANNKDLRRRMAPQEGNNVIEIEMPVLPSREIGNKYGGWGDKDRVENNPFLKQIAKFYYQHFTRLTREVELEFGDDDPDWLGGYWYFKNQGSVINDLVFVTQETKSISSESIKASLKGRIGANNPDVVEPTPTARIQGPKNINRADDSGNVRVFLNATESFTLTGYGLSYTWERKPAGGSYSTVQSDGVLLEDVIGDDENNVVAPRDYVYRLTVEDEGSNKTDSVEHAVTVAPSEDGTTPTPRSEEYDVNTWQQSETGYIDIIPADFTGLDTVEIRKAVGANIEEGTSFTAIKPFQKPISTDSNGDPKIDTSANTIRVDGDYVTHYSNNDVIYLVEETDGTRTFFTFVSASYDSSNDETVIEVSSIPSTNYDAAGSASYVASVDLTSKHTSALEARVTGNIDGRVTRVLKTFDLLQTPEIRDLVLYFKNDGEALLDVDVDEDTDNFDVEKQLNNNGWTTEGNFTSSSISGLQIYGASTISDGDKVQVRVTPNSSSTTGDETIRTQYFNRDDTGGYTTPEVTNISANIDSTGDVTLTYGINANVKSSEVTSGSGSISNDTDDTNGPASVTTPVLGNLNKDEEATITVTVYDGDSQSGTANAYDITIRRAVDDDTVPEITLFDTNFQSDGTLEVSYGVDDDVTSSEIFVDPNGGTSYTSYGTFGSGPATHSVNTGTDTVAVGDTASIKVELNGGSEVFTTDARRGVDADLVPEILSLDSSVDGNGNVDLRFAIDDDVKSYEIDVGATGTANVSADKTGPATVAENSVTSLNPGELKSIKLSVFDETGQSGASTSITFNVRRAVDSDQEPEVTHINPFIDSSGNLAVRYGIDDDVADSSVTVTVDGSSDTVTDGSAGPGSVLLNSFTVSADPGDEATVEVTVNGNGNSNTFTTRTRLSIDANQEPEVLSFSHRFDGNDDLVVDFSIDADTNEFDVEVDPDLDGTYEYSNTTSKAGPATHNETTTTVSKGSEADVRIKVRNTDLSTTKENTFETRVRNLIDADDDPEVGNLDAYIDSSGEITFAVTLDDDVESITYEVTGDVSVGATDVTGLSGPTVYSTGTNQDLGFGQKATVKVTPKRDGGSVTGPTAEADVEIGVQESRDKFTTQKWQDDSTSPRRGILDILPDDFGVVNTVYYRYKSGGELASVPKDISNYDPNQAGGNTREATVKDKDGDSNNDTYRCHVDLTTKHTSVIEYYIEFKNAEDAVGVAVFDYDTQAELRTYAVYTENTGGGAKGYVYVDIEADEDTDSVSLEADTGGGFSGVNDPSSTSVERFRLEQSQPLKLNDGDVVTVRFTPSNNTYGTGEVETATAFYNESGWIKKTDKLLNSISGYDFAAGTLQTNTSMVGVEGQDDGNRFIRMGIDGSNLEFLAQNDNNTFVSIGTGRSRGSEMGITVKQTGALLFEVEESGATIAGWSFDASMLEKTTSDGITIQIGSTDTTAGLSGAQGFSTHDLGVYQTVIGETEVPSGGSGHGIISFKDSGSTFDDPTTYVTMGDPGKWDFGFQAAVNGNDIFIMTDNQQYIDNLELRTLTVAETLTMGTGGILKAQSNEYRLNDTQILAGWDPDGGGGSGIHRVTIDQDGINIITNDPNDPQRNRVEWYDESNNLLGYISADGSYDSTNSESDATMQLFSGFNLLIDLDGATGNLEVKRSSATAETLFEAEMVEHRLKPAPGGKAFAFHTFSANNSPYLDIYELGKNSSGSTEPSSPPTAALRLYVDDDANGNPALFAKNVNGSVTQITGAF